MDQDGLWVELPEEKEKIFSVSIYDLRGRCLASQQFFIGADSNRYHWNVDHTSWPGGSYKLVVKGDRSLRQLMVTK